jgi:hypothetical protein
MPRKGYGGRAIQVRIRATREKLRIMPAKRRGAQSKTTNAMNVINNILNI